jgi:CelD/BcsL family acetyltransferase involved in cellulose biosynthesis
VTGDMTSETVDPVADPRWRELVEAAPGASIFHHPSWIGLLRDQYRYEPQAWAVADTSGRLVAGLPLVRVSTRLTSARLVALPFSDVCPPLCLAERPDAEEALWRLVAERRRDSGLPLEVRAGVDVDDARPVASYRHHLLALSPDVDEVRAGFRSQVRRNVAKAQRTELVTARETDAEGLTDFYSLHLRTRRRQGVPTQPRSFILGFERLFDEGLGFVQTVRLAGEPVAAAVLLVAAGTITYKYGASDVAYQRLRPNNLLFMAVIEWACQQRLRTLDFGRSDEENEGLRAFKRSWGASELPLTYSSLGAEPGRDHAGLQRAIAQVIRRTPPFVGRWIGEAMYRHAG